MAIHARAQETTFYEELQNCPELDLRDRRGKVHDLAFVLLGVIIGLLRCRDGVLSSIHRCMVNNHDNLCKLLNLDIERVVSRAQLPRILEKVNLSVFERLLFSYCKIQLSPEQKQWFAGDGKELRGSIKKGDKRGEVIVQLVRHDDLAVAGQAFYNGTKESEKPCLQQLIKDTGVEAQKVTADALHLSPATTKQVEAAGGIYIIGLKSNQEELLQDMTKHSQCFKPINEETMVDKGHGRIDIRHYCHFDVSDEYFDERWNKSGFRSLFKVERKRINLKTNEESTEISYYMSNADPKEQDDYFGAIRGHWSVEVSNRYRDVSLREDQLRTKKNIMTKVMAGARTIVLELFRIWNPKNVIAQMEYFQDNFTELIQSLKKIRFL